MLGDGALVQTEAFDIHYGANRPAFGAILSASIVAEFLIRFTPGVQFKVGSRPFYSRPRVDIRVLIINQFVPMVAVPMEWVFSDASLIAEVGSILVTCL